MKEKIILSNINEKELLKTFALNESSSFNTRIFNAELLAKEVLIRNGNIINKKQISSIEQECAIYNIIKNINYFKDNSFLDAKNINNAITYARKLCRGNEEETIEKVFSDGEFKEKNNAILQVYKQYKQFLQDNNLTDPIEIINIVIKNSYTLDSEYIRFKETPLDPLEEELLKTVSNGKTNNPITIREYVQKNYKPLTKVTYANAYGSVNEVEYILGYIAKNDISYDDCSVVLLDNSYIKHLTNYKDVYKVPMTFGVGQDLSLANSFKILILLDRWNKQYNAFNSLNNLLYAPEFNTNKFWNTISEKELNNRTKSEIIKAVGNLKLSIYKNEKLEKYKNSLTDEKEINRYQYVEKIANEFYKGYSYLIKTYTNIDNNLLENKAINTICTYIDDYFKNVPEKNIEDNLPQQLDDIISALENKKILKEASKPGYLHITDLNGALSCIRKHMFICGLNANVFPGTPIEDYLLLDSDLDRFNELNVKNSNNKINLNKQLLIDVIDNAATFDSEIHLSYAGYNLSELKQENPSSMLFEIFKKQKGEQVTTQELQEAIGKQHKYFDEDISTLKNIGNKYLDGISIKEDNVIEQDTYSSTKLECTISPSSADIFFTCPKRFYLTKILGIVEPEDDNPFKTIPSNDEGTLVHECMEDYGNNPTWNKQQFMDNAKEKFEAYFNKRIPLHYKEMDTLKKEYLRMAEIGYDQDPKEKEVIASEKYLGPYLDSITGLTFGGIVDRLEKLPNGKYRIVDYKTYKEKKNIERDIASCFQVALYAYILENDKNDPKQIEDCEYRYLRNPMIVKVGYHDIKEQLKERLTLIKNALDSGEFDYAKNPKEDCEYCKLKQICGINKEDKSNG